MHSSVRVASLLALGACILLAQTPDDISFRLRLTKDTPQYLPDEPISFEISLSTSSPQKYYGSWTSLQPHAGGASVHLEPETGTVNLMLFAQGFAGSIPGSIGYMTSTPMTEQADMTQWYRFDKPGRFRLSLAVDWFWLVKPKDGGGGKEHLSLQSNEVEFEVLPADPALEAQQLATILNEIDHPENDRASQAAMQRLDLMQSPAATDEKLRRFLSSAQTNYSPFYSMLLHSAAVDQVVPALKAALTNPLDDPPAGIIDLLAGLEVRKTLGDPSPQPSDRDALEKWQADLAKRSKLHEELVAKNTELLLNSVRNRSGPQRLNALFQAWSNLEREPIAASTPSESLQHLREELLSAASDLSPAQQSQFLSTGWDKLPHSNLLPLIRRLANANGPAAWGRDQAFQYWCQDWPADCGKAILTTALGKNSPLTVQTILLIAEAEHPELDVEFKRQLADEEWMRADARADASVGRTAALILRAGSKNLDPEVQTYMDGKLSSQPHNCVVDELLPRLSASRRSETGYKPAAALFARRELPLLRSTTAERASASRNGADRYSGGGQGVEFAVSANRRRRSSVPRNGWPRFRALRVASAPSGSPRTLARQDS